MKAQAFFTSPLTMYLVTNISRGGSRFPLVIPSPRYTGRLFQTGLIYESNSIFSKMWDVICVLLQGGFPSANTQSQ